MISKNWEFAIDVGGTFTDVVASDPFGRLFTHKILSSGVCRCVAIAGSTRKRILIRRSGAERDHLWVGYSMRFMDVSNETPVRRVIHSRASGGHVELVLDEDSEFEPRPEAVLELYSGEPAPVIAIRQLMGIRLTEPVGPVVLRLGTTRATNALLERKGARTAFVTTRGFGDILKIGNQDRPDLFRLEVRKRDELAQYVIEVEERTSASGERLVVPRETKVREQLARARNEGIEAVAICLLHAAVNPANENLVAEIAEQVGFRHVSRSSRVARLDRIVPRGDTTVLDAYVGPVIQEYVRSLRVYLPEAAIWLMTSNGGLVRAENASGKDTVLSGPAGGVIGCAQVATRAGFSMAIAFDMGGTSTDVTRIDGPFEYQHDTVKAGVRVMAPMLPVETVAAGGGSICGFDGQKLVVGPSSAGADPGPACYGRGGPLTLTDVNVFLGRVIPDHFPFPLDREVVERKLAEVQAEVVRALDKRMTLLELSDGFVRIANERMAAAINVISSAKGYDLREYALAAFGGAGGQHACALARRLGMRRVLASPFAGVLSALGISAARVQRILERSLCLEFGREGAQNNAEQVLTELFDGARKTLLCEGISDLELSRPMRSLDVCYVGQSTTLTLPADPWSSLRARFEDCHRRHYGYAHTDRALEIRAARVELGTHGREHPGPVRGKAALELTTPRTTLLAVDGRWREVPLWVRAELAIGSAIQGPAVIDDETSTLVVDAGWTGELLETGDIVLCDGSLPEPKRTVDSSADPIQLELFHNRFAAIAEQMGQALRRTAMSTNVKDRLDFSCAVFDDRGNLVANAPHIPVHLGGMSDCVKCLMADVRTFKPGDVYVTNDPFRGGSHLNDVTVITPIFDASNERPLFFTASRAHHAEIGGTRPGSMPPDSRSLAEEGVLIRTFPLVQDGVSRYDELRHLLTSAPFPSRAPLDNLADVAAQAAANQKGATELLSLVRSHGATVVTAFMGHIQDAAERKMRAVLARLPNGTHCFEDCLDDGSSIRAEIQINERGATVDFSGTGPAHRGNLNANRAIVSSAIMYCFRCLMDEDIPLNSGVLRPIDIILPTCFLNPPLHEDPSLCPAVAGGNVETSQRIVDVIFGALKSVSASQGTMNNVLMGNEQFGYYETICGGAGAGPGFHGADAVHTHMTNTRLTDPEILEARYPIRLVEFAIRKGSGGSGVFQGGCGVLREYEFLASLEISVISQRRTRRPYGLCGGESGASGRNLLRRSSDQHWEVLPGITSIRVAPHDRLRIETPGGGGYGSARRRSGDE